MEHVVSEPRLGGLAIALLNYSPDEVVSPEFIGEMAEYAALGTSIDRALDDFDMGTYLIEAVDALRSTSDRISHPGLSTKTLLERRLQFLTR